jgi:hypothetical protein
VCVIVSLVVGGPKEYKHKPKKQLQRDKIIPNWTCNRLPVRVSVHTYIYNTRCHLPSVLYLLLPSASGRLFCQHHIKTNKKLFHIFLRLFFSLSLLIVLSLFFYMLWDLCVCVCVYCLVCVCFSFSMFGLFFSFFLLFFWYAVEWEQIGR